MTDGDQTTDGPQAADDAAASRRAEAERVRAMKRDLDDHPFREEQPKLAARRA